MEKAEYLQIQMAIIGIGKTAATLNLETFIAKINETEATAPMIDPTLYRKAAENLRAIKNLAESVLAVKESFNILFGSVIKTAAKGHMEMLPPEPPKGA